MKEREARRAVHPTDLPRFEGLWKFARHWTWRIRRLLGPAQKAAALVRGRSRVS